jgi:nifR3 family TIM-barrel protein
MKYVLAPLAEFTDAPFRLICTEAGADMTYTEMVSAAALFHGHGPTRHLMETMPGEAPVACQIFGAKEDEIAFAAREASKLRVQDGVSPRFCAIDLNAGCPMPRIVRSGAGACLVADPERVYRLLRAMVENTGLPVTLKTRLGPHTGDNRIFELVDAAERAGAKGITVHARYTSQMHGGPTHLDVLAEVVRRTKLPVTGNGGIQTVADARAMEQTGVVAVMVARTALRDPSIFARLKGLEGGEISGPEWARRHLEHLLVFRRMLAEKYPEDHVPCEDGYVGIKMHTHLFRYFRGLPGASALRARLSSIRTLAEVREIFGA